MIKKQLSVQLSRSDARLLEEEAARQRIPLAVLIRSQIEPLLIPLRQKKADATNIAGLMEKSDNSPRGARRAI